MGTSPGRSRKYLRTRPTKSERDFLILLKGEKHFPIWGWVSSDHKQIPLLKLRIGFTDKQVWDSSLHL